VHDPIAAGAAVVQNGAMKSTLLGSLVLACMLLPIAGALPTVAGDVNGKWTAEVQGGDQVYPITLTLKADGDKLTGTMGGPGGEYPINEGTIKGDEVSFNVVIDFNGNSLKLIYTGKVAGDEIKFHLVPEGAEDYAQDFTAKRAS
jgi:hypothetical protein